MENVHVYAVAVHAGRGTGVHAGVRGCGVAGEREKEFFI